MPYIRVWMREWYRCMDAANEKGFGVAVLMTASPVDFSTHALVVHTLLTFFVDQYLHSVGPTVSLLLKSGWCLCRLALDCITESWWPHLVCCLMHGRNSAVDVCYRPGEPSSTACPSVALCLSLSPPGFTLGPSPPVSQGCPRHAWSPDPHTQSSLSSLCCLWPASGCGRAFLGTYFPTPKARATVSQPTLDMLEPNDALTGWR